MKWAKGFALVVLALACFPESARAAVCNADSTFCFDEATSDRVSDLLQSWTVNNDSISCGCVSDFVLRDPKGPTRFLVSCGRLVRILAGDELVRAAFITAEAGLELEKLLPDAPWASRLPPDACRSNGDLVLTHYLQSKLLSGSELAWMRGASSADNEKTRAERAKELARDLDRSLSQNPEALSRGLEALALERHFRIEGAQEDELMAALAKQLRSTRPQIEGTKAGLGLVRIALLGTGRSMLALRDEQVPAGILAAAADVLTPVDLRLFAARFLERFPKAGSHQLREAAASSDQSLAAFAFALLLASGDPLTTRRHERFSAFVFSQRERCLFAEAVAKPKASECPTEKIDRVERALVLSAVVRKTQACSGVDGFLKTIGELPPDDEARALSQLSSLLGQRAGPEGGLLQRRADTAKAWESIRGKFMEKCASLQSLKSGTASPP